MPIDTKTYVGLSLLLLTFNAGSTVLNQATLQSDNSMTYSPFVTAATTEFIKLLVAGCLLSRDIFNSKGTTNGKINNHPDTVVMPTSPSFIIKYAVPGLLYAVCNVLNYVVVSMVGSTNYQLLNNMKIITTAVIYRLVLGREIKMIQWTAIMLLAVAMCVSALQNCPKPIVPGTNEPPLRMTAGIVTMILVSCLSSLAGVYNEKLIKGTEANVWYQNVLLYIWTFSFCIGKQLLSSEDATTRTESDATGGDANGIFHGFTFVLWLVILMKAFYGQVVGLVFKYADNILKVYASSMSVIVSAVLCWMFLGIPLTGSSIVAGVLVIIATMLYYNYKNLMMTDTETCSACMSMLPCGSSGSRLPHSYAPVEQNDKKDDDSNAGQA